MQCQWITSLPLAPVLLETTKLSRSTAPFVEIMNWIVYPFSAPPPPNSPPSNTGWHLLAIHLLVENNQKYCPPLLVPPPPPPPPTLETSALHTGFVEDHELSVSVSPSHSLPPPPPPILGHRWTPNTQVRFTKPNTKAHWFTQHSSCSRTAWHCHYKSKPV